MWLYVSDQLLCTTLYVNVDCRTCIHKESARVNPIRSTDYVQLSSLKLIVEVHQIVAHFLQYGTHNVEPCVKLKLYMTLYGPYMALVAAWSMKEHFTTCTTKTRDKTINTCTMYK